jgi:hypothetical protein
LQYLAQDDLGSSANQKLPVYQLTAPNTSFKCLTSNSQCFVVFYYIVCTPGKVSIEEKESAAGTAG